MTTAAKKKKRPSYPHKGKRRPFTATAEQFVAMDQEAKIEGMTWTQWALAVLLARIKYAQTRERAAARR